MSSTGHRRRHAVEASGERATPLLSVRGLKKYFPLRSGWGFRRPEWVRAVDGISLDLERGETVGLVGESGCGKSTTARLLLRLIEPTAGEIRFEGRDVLAMGPEELMRLRRRMQLVFQDPVSSLNPRMRVSRALEEVLWVHGLAGDGSGRRGRVRELLEMVGLGSEHAERFPHELSGGQRQRVGIARALAVEPDLLVCDEPVSALDRPVQSQILTLLRELQEQFGLACLLIAHDLTVVREVCDRVAVMYLGRVVESAPTPVLFRDPAHPYTRALLAAAPDLDGELSNRAGARATEARPEHREVPVPLEGEAERSAAVPAGCPFHSRCPHPARDQECLSRVPPLVPRGKAGRVACIKAR